MTHKITLTAITTLLLSSACSVSVAPPAPGSGAQTVTSTDTSTTTPEAVATAATAAPTTATTSTTSPERSWLVIHGVGDVNLDGDVIGDFRVLGYEHAWSGLGDIFLTDDITVINLECSPSPDGPPEPKQFVFGCDPEAYPAAVAAGVDVANLGNNHSQDYGKAAMLTGRAILEAAGLHPIGAGSNAAEAGRPALIEVGGWTVAVLGFGGVFPHEGWFATDGEPGMRDGDTIETMVEAVEAADQIADLVIVTIHWGVELDTTPRDEDRERAEAMIAAGADAIFGHHPHRLQPFEMVDGRPVAWSLGNFVWPNLSTAGSTTAIARVVVSPSGEVTGCLIPAFISSPGHPVITGEAECGPGD